MGLLALAVANRVPLNARHRGATNSLQASEKA